MISDHEDRILEAGLAEVVGGNYPPDLSARILQAWEERSGKAASVPSSFASAVSPLPPPNFPVAEPVAPPVHRKELPLPTTRQRSRPSAAATWLSLGVAASLLIILASVGIYVARNANQMPAPEIARVQPPVDDPGYGARLLESAPGSDRQANTDHRVGMQGHESEIGPDRRGSAPGGTHRPPVDALVETQLPSTLVAESQTPPVADSEVIRFVNDTLSAKWREQGITPAPPVDDRQWCQRVYQRLIGRQPDADEMKQFLSLPGEERRKDLVDALLASDAYARHWANIWSDALIGGADREPQRGDQLEQHLFAALRNDKPYDQIAAELISATGTCDVEAEDFNGASSFLAGLASDDYVPAADRVSRVFLGKQLVCTRCHDHPANGWDQSEFWELNAFFRQMKLRQDPQTRVVTLLDQDFYGQTGVAQDAEIFYEDEDGRLRVAYPELGGTSVPHSGLVSNVNRRRELAKLIVVSPDFRVAVVNRIWGELLQYGFVEPVDDFGPHNPPSHPELLQHLSSQLAAHEFNLDGLMRWIVLSRAFELSDQQTAESWMDTPDTGGRPMFARFYTEPRQPRDLYQSLMLAVRSRPPSLGVQAGTLARRSWSPTVATAPQIIDTQGAELLAGPRWLDLLAASKMTREDKIEHLFLSVMDRQPSGREKMAAKLVLADRMNDQVAIREIWQTLAASQAAGRSALAER